MLYTPFGVDPPESLTVADGDPLGWLATVKAFSESNTIELVS